MNGLIHSSLYFGMLVSVGAYMLGVWLKKKTGWAILNPLLVAIIVVIAFLSVFHGQFSHSQPIPAICEARDGGTGEECSWPTWSGSYPVAIYSLNSQPANKLLVPNWTLSFLPMAKVLSPPFFSPDRRECA